MLLLLLLQQIFEALRARLAPQSVSGRPGRLGRSDAPRVWRGRGAVPSCLRDFLGEDTMNGFVEAISPTTTIGA